jgi:hypothetical protein
MTSRQLYAISGNPCKSTTHGLSGPIPASRTCIRNPFTLGTNRALIFADSVSVSSRAFDGRGNYSLGIREQIVFPEIDYDKVDTLRGMDIVITTSACNDEEGRALLEGFNFPFRK